MRVAKVVCMVWSEEWRTSHHEACVENDGSKQARNEKVLLCTEGGVEKMIPLDETEISRR